MSGQPLTWLLVVLSLSACHSNPPAPPQAPAATTSLLSGLSNYARQLQQQDEPALLAEKARLESLPESPERNLRLALVLGHEPAGEVVGAGAGVTKYKAGDRVAIEPSLTCGHCEFCLIGKHNHCLHSSFMGSPQEPGLLREFATIPQHNAIHFPDGFTYAQATLIEPLAVIMQADSHRQMKTAIHIDPGLTAPVHQGQKVGSFTVTAPDFPPLTVPLYAAEGVAQQGVMRGLWRGTLGLVGLGKK